MRELLHPTEKFAKKSYMSCEDSDCATEMLVILGRIILQHGKDNSLAHCD